MTGSMESTKCQILSTNKARIFCECNEFFIVHWSMKEYDEYQIVTVIEFSNGKRSQMSRIIQASDVDSYISNQDNVKKIVSELKIGNSKIILDKMKDNIVAKKGITLIFEGDSYLIVREHHDAEEIYTLEAPPNGKSGMANNYPWSHRITKDQAEVFSSNHNIGQEYYNQVRYA